MADSPIVPPPPLAKVQAVDKQGVMTNPQLSQQQRLWEFVTRGHATIPSTVSGSANALILTPNLNNRPIPNYFDGMSFYFTPNSNTTGPVTIAVGELDALPALDGNGSPLSSLKSLKAGIPYTAYYSAQLNSFVIPTLVSSGGMQFITQDTVSAVGQSDQIGRAHV